MEQPQRTSYLSAKENENLRLPAAGFCVCVVHLPPRIEQSVFHRLLVHFDVSLSSVQCLQSRVPVVTDVGRLIPQVEKS